MIIKCGVCGVYIVLCILKMYMLKYEVFGGVR